MARINPTGFIDCPVHVCSRSNNRDSFPLPERDVWTIFEDYLYLMKIGFNVRIHNFVLMKNHYHLIVSAQENNLAEALKYTLYRISREMSLASGTRNHQFGNRCFRSIISNYHYYMHAYKYVYRNPVTAGVCNRVEDYPFSTLNGLIGKSRLVIPVENDLLLMDNFEQTLEWLNKAPSAHDHQTMKNALRRGLLKIGKSSGGVTSPLENHLY